MRQLRQPWLALAASAMILAGCGGGDGDGGTSVSGRLLVAPGIYADAPDGGRDVASPATASGYAERLGAGDAFRTTLARGQPVSLLSADGSRLSLSLCPLPSGICALTRTETAVPVRTLLVPADGDYEITVRR
ncbi:MAG: hypothetical protein U5L11_16195 [Arhodomonas sp.]|nr:hypothetical protein [Arhodomonas sp.]